jgi:GTPase SAR1 family protein
MLKFFKGFVSQFFNIIFRKKNHIKLGLYGPPNGGKTTLANVICQDWLGQDMGTVSNVAHETREIQIKEEIHIKSKDGKEISFNLVDTPGITTKIDYEDFLKHGMNERSEERRVGKEC